eukprot:219868-Chlamydomonas_euryale.AAC.1
MVARPVHSHTSGGAAPAGANAAAEPAGRPSSHSLAKARGGGDTRLEDRNGMKGPHQWADTAPPMRAESAGGATAAAA